ncbi:hypothetical protein DL93DRAFT_110511 [Clavulina sp. PMI_390]|nr:hypothetical protein DL93DRAFT_110511 [Clavulina sp. PMI_390]
MHEYYEGRAWTVGSGQGTQSGRSQRPMMIYGRGDTVRASIHAVCISSSRASPNRGRQWSTREGNGMYSTNSSNSSKRVINTCSGQVGREARYTVSIQTRDNDDEKERKSSRANREHVRTGQIRQSCPCSLSCRGPGRPFCASGDSASSSRIARP